MNPVLFAAIFTTLTAAVAPLCVAFCSKKKRKAEKDVSVQQDPPMQRGGDDSKEKTKTSPDQPAPVAPPGGSNEKSTEDVKIEGGGKSAEPKPAEMPLDEKQMQIAEGKKCGKNDYPTMDDVMSDWSSDSEGDDKNAKEKKEKEEKEGGGGEEKKKKKRKKKPKSGEKKSKKHKKSGGGGGKEKSERSHKSKKSQKSRKSRKDQKRKGGRDSD